MEHGGSSYKECQMGMGCGPEGDHDEHTHRCQDSLPCQQDPCYLPGLPSCSADKPIIQTRKPHSMTTKKLLPQLSPLGLSQAPPESEAG